MEPFAKSLMFSALCGRAPSLTATCKNKVLLYKFSINDKVLSATSSTHADGTLQTATPAIIKQNDVFVKEQSMLNLRWTSPAFNDITN